MRFALFLFSIALICYFYASKNQWLVIDRKSFLVYILKQSSVIVFYLTFNKLKIEIKRTATVSIFDNFSLK